MRGRHTLRVFGGLLLKVKIARRAYEGTNLSALAKAENYVAALDFVPAQELVRRLLPSALHTTLSLLTVPRAF